MIIVMFNVFVHFSVVFLRRGVFVLSSSHTFAFNVGACSLAPNPSRAVHQNLLVPQVTFHAVNPLGRRKERTREIKARKGETFAVDRDRDMQIEYRSVRQVDRFISCERLHELPLETG